MAVAAGDALLGGPRALGVGLEEFGAVVGLDDDDVAGAEVLADMLGRVTEIGQKDEGAARGKQVVVPAGGEAKADGIVGVVRDGETLDVEVAETKTGAGLEELPRGAVRGVEFLLDRAGGGGVGEDREVGKFLEALDAGGVVAVLVREKNRVDARERFAGGGEQVFEFSGGETGVDEDARALGDEQGGVARAAGAEDGETHGHRES